MALHLAYWILYNYEQSKLNIYSIIVKKTRHF